MSNFSSFAVSFFSLFGFFLLSLGQTAFGYSEHIEIDPTEPKDSTSRNNLRSVQPHLILMIGDDIGWNDVGWHNPTIYTPFMNKLASEGVILNSYYTFSQCTPSRAALLTGMYPSRLGLQRGVLLDLEPYGIPLSFSLLPEQLRAVGYQTHALGKWHVGYCHYLYTPTFRGFDSFLGFYNGAEENFLHCTSGSLVFTKETCDGFDFYNNTKEAPEYYGQFSVCLPNHLEKCKNNVNEARKTYCGSMAALDESVQLITNALKLKDMWENTVLLFISDNGGSTSFGGNNYPLRGEKLSQWEGGSRVPSFIHSPLLKKKKYVNNQLIHVTDWHATFLRLAGAKAVSGIDGIDQWSTISENKPSARKDLPYLFDQRNGTVLAAIRDSKYKLIVGPPGNNDGIYPERASVDQSFNVSYLEKHMAFDRDPYNFSDRGQRLFDLENDPSENDDVSALYPEIVQRMLKRVIEYEKHAKPAIKIPKDQAGHPSKWGGWYRPGWCIARVHVAHHAVNTINYSNYFGL